MTFSRVREFRRIVWSHYKKEGRDTLPWRKTKDPYRILVSEMMLQQTQVPRVIEKYKSFLEKFPNVRALAKAPLSEVLKEWSGLGYNRRGKYLHDAAKLIVEKYPTNFNYAAVQLKLPGVGPYTKAAVAIFAWNAPEVLIETNIRTAFIHHFYSSVLQKTSIADSDILKLAAEAAKGQDPRTWHWALMDYGSYLKKNGVRNNARSKHYTKQSKFEGSLREVRGEILRQLHAAKQPKGDSRLSSALQSLARDGLIVKKKGKWRIG